MANGNLSFSVAINLLTENFKRGQNELKNGLRSIQMQAMGMVAAFGAGSIGLGNFVEKLIETSRETSKANTALKNISGSAQAFGTNQQFLIDLSKKYGLYVNDLVSNFAKFTAAATNANMPMKDQQKLFESLSRASVAFGLSSDETNGVFLAVSQMMGKGKISAEELRGQLGERMPIAMQAMAKAAGVTVGQLGDLMKQGKLMSADVLPKFADALNKMLPNVSTDNLESSLNRVKNSFKELTDKMGIGDTYKKLVDGLSKAFQYIISNFKTVGDIVVNIISTIIIAKGFQMILNQYKNLERQALISARKQARIAGESFDEMGYNANKFGNTAKFAFTQLGTVMKAAFAQIGFMVIISAITAIIQKVVEWKRKQDEIKAIWTDYQKQTKNIGSTNEEIVKLKALQSVMNDKTQSQKNINKAQSELMNMLGIEKGTQEEINKRISERIDLLKNASKASFYTGKLTETQDKINNLASGVSLSPEALQRLVKSYIDNNVSGKGMLSDGAKKWQKDISSEVRKTGNNGVYDLDGIIDAVKEAGQLNRILNDANRQLKKSIVPTSTTTGTTSTNTTTDNELTKIEKDYKAQLKEYSNQLKNGAIDQRTYNKLIDELNKNTNNKLSGMLSPSQAKNNETFQKTKAGVLNPKYTKEDEATLKFDEEQVKYNSTLKALNKKHELGIIDNTKYNEELNSLIESTVNAVLSIDNIGATADEFVKTLSGKVIKKLKDYSLPEATKIDHTFDYKKNDVEKQKDVQEANNQNIKNYSEKLGGDSIIEKIKSAKGDLTALKAQFNGQADELINALAEALKKAPNLAEALKIQEVKKDVKDLQKQFDSGLYSGVKDVANGARNMVESFKNLSEVMSNTDASGFEKIMAIWDTMTNTIDNILSVIEMIKNLTEVTKALGLAKQTEAAIDTAVTGQKVANAVTSAGADIAATGVHVATSQTTVEADTATTMSGAAASGAKSGLPFPWNLITIGASIAGAVALLSQIPKFENGGIVGGSSFTGDKLLARINSGEMVLNKNQQGTLYGLLNNQNNNSGGGKVDFRITGTVLDGVLKNHNAIKNKTK